MSTVKHNPECEPNNCLWPNCSCSRSPNFHLMENQQKDNIQFFKCTFTFKQHSPYGGFGEWEEKIEIYQASDEKELNDKINAFIKNDMNSYRKHIKLKDVIKL